MNNSSLTNRPSYHINLVVYYWENCIGISKDAIKALNKPKYISLRVNTKLRSIAIIPCTQNDPMSFEVPQKLFTDHFPIGKARIRDLHNRVYNECRFQTLLS